jgi:hypothetical protein
MDKAVITAARQQIVELEARLATGKFPTFVNVGSLYVARRASKNPTLCCLAAVMAALSLVSLV